MLLRLGIPMAIFTLCRILFFLFNKSLFSDLSAGEIFVAFLAGLRFDLSALILINCIFILGSVLPFPFRNKKTFQSILKWFFISTNGFALAFNLFDIIFYRFTLRRSTWDLFSIMGASNDTTRLIPTFAKDYWYMIVIFIFLIWLMIFLYKKIKLPEKEIGFSLKYFISQFLIFLFVSASAVLGFRGGFQVKPITIVSASEYGSTNSIPLILNTPFSIIKSSDMQQDIVRIYFSDAEARKFLNPIHPADTGVFRNKNVVIIILESFSKEYIGALSGKKTSTPFLDSLIEHSLVFDNAYANSKRSIEGIPAIVASIPANMNDPFITSIFGIQHFCSLPNRLKLKGYNSTFYHGGENGTMCFDLFCNVAGFDSYFGRTEYANEKDYDGHWGIWDEEFLQRVADDINKKPKPSFSTIFTLSSHYPFNVPARYQTTFKDDPNLPIIKSISYTDYALKRFFEKASKMSWYANTLFVITADHAGPPSGPFYSNDVGKFQVPIIYYAPGDTSLPIFRSSVTTQHIDIMPTVLDYLNYDLPFYSLGKSQLKTSQADSGFSRAFLFSDDLYISISGNYTFQFDGQKTVGVYCFSNDSLLQHNLLQTYDRNLLHENENALKAFCQQYSVDLLRKNTSTPVFFH